MGQQRVWLVMALVLGAAIAVMAISAVPTVKLSGLLGVVPLLASARCSGRMTALAACYVLALGVVVTVVTNTSGTGTSWRFAALIQTGIRSPRTRPARCWLPRDATAG